MVANSNISNAIYLLIKAFYLKHLFIARMQLQVLDPVGTVLFVFSSHP